jgi:hypothetical protein
VCLTCDKIITYAAAAAKKKKPPDTGNIYIYIYLLFKKEETS